MSVEELCEQNQNYRYEIVEAREKILALEKKIKANEKVIWTKCEHEWQYDTASGVYERNCYYCKHCKLWRNHYMYQ